MYEEFRAIKYIFHTWQIDFAVYIFDKKWGRFSDQKMIVPLFMYFQLVSQQNSTYSYCNLS